VAVREAAGRSAAHPALLRLRRLWGLGDGDGVSVEHCSAVGRARRLSGFLPTYEKMGLVG